MTQKYNIVYCAPKLEAFLKLSENNADGLLYEKELIYEGAFVKKNGASDGTDLSFAVGETELQHWKNIGELMLQNGVEIPMPVMHTDDPEKKRANIVGYRLGVNKDGKKSLYGTAKFVDNEAAKLASADVSIFVPIEAHDGRGNTYPAPIQHVAFTNYPVIPGLEKFQAIAASYDKGDNSMPSAILLSLAKKLGIEPLEEEDDEKLADKIVAAFTPMKEKEEEEKKKEPTVIPQPIVAAFTTLMKDNRNNKLDQLVKDGHATKACRDALAAELCKDSVLALSLSVDVNGSPVANSDSFDKILEALKHNKIVGYDEKTGMQVPDAIALSRETVKKQEESDLVKAAERRAAAAKQ